MVELALVRWSGRSAAALVLIALVLGIWTAPASAHADLVSSTPAAGATVSESPESIELEFSAELDPVGDEVAVTVDGTSASGEITIDGADVRFIPSEPLPAGVATVVWRAKAGDAHPRTGEFSFSIGATSGAVPGASSATMPPGHDMSNMGADPNAEAGSSAEADRTWPNIQAAFKFVMYVSLLLALGGLIFLAVAHQGHPGESRWISYIVRRAAVVAVIASIGELWTGASWLAGATAWPWRIGDYVNFLAPPNGVGFALRFVGLGLVLAAPLPALQQVHRRDEHVTVSVGSMALALTGATMVAVSVVFVGHSMSRASGILGWVADAVHTVAAAGWAGGVAILALVLGRRWIRREHLDAWELGVWFSPLAAVGLVALAVTGTVMGAMEVTSPGALVSTSFGQALLVKLGFVAVAAGIGGYNKYVVIPSIDAGVDEVGHRRLTRVARVESLIMLGALAATAFLVDAG